MTKTAITPVYIAPVYTIMVTMNSLLREHLLLQKSAIILILTIFMTILLSASASAEVKITNNSQILEVDYNQFSEETQKQITVNGKVSLSNTGAETVNLVISFQNLPADYTAEEITGISLAAGENKTISYTIKVPHKKDSGKSAIGTLAVQDASSKAVLASQSITQDTKSMLSLYEIKVEYTDKNGKAQTERLGSEQKEQLKLEGNIKAGTEVKMTLSTENLFDRDYDQDYAELDDIELLIEPDDKDLFANKMFDKIYTFENLDAHKKDQKIITFIVSEDVDPDEFVFEITLRGEDGKNLNHEVHLELSFSVERIRDDVRIVTAEITPAEISCEKSANIRVVLKNFGTNDQDFAGLIIYNKKLEVNKNIQDIYLSRSSKNENVYEFKMTIDLPANIAAGAYPVDATALIQRDKTIDNKIIPFKISACSAPSPPQKEPVKEPAKASPTPEKSEKTEPPAAGAAAKKSAASSATPTAAPTPAVGTTSTIVKTVEDPYSSDDLTAGLLLVGIVIILAFITWALVLLFREE